MTRYYESTIKFHTSEEVDRTEVKQRIFSDMNLDFDVDDIALEEEEGDRTSWDYADSNKESEE